MTIQVPIYTSVSHLAISTITLLLQLVLVFNLPRRILRNIIKNLKQVGKDSYSSFDFVFLKANLDQLIVHGLRALRDTLQQDKELSIQNVSIGIVGKDQKWVVHENENVARYLDLLNQEVAPAAAPMDTA